MQTDQMYITWNLAKKSLRSKRIPTRFFVRQDFRSRAITQLAAGQELGASDLGATFF
jgi:hypothetical protein